ncbi:MAG: AbrB/MazE/SpoVT family DNA-binding domain-containing protein [Candidatus Hydrogenedentes bacterium]|nr:AbrB/MazE/SpoVT family DNA-binding domain-containing protein [Candidatus Hydrogenedentota bacterium]
MSCIGRISAKGETAIPLEIRTALAVQPGDLLEWEITGDGRAEVRRILPADDYYLRALSDTLNEWASDEDELAYREL